MHNHYKNRLLYSFLSVIFTVFFLSCSRYPQDVEHALKLAGDNRAELEKVLEHYRNNPADSLKYKAACFLIRNMPYHYTHKGDEVDAYHLGIADLINDKINITETVSKINDFNGTFHRFASYIAADIQNIDFNLLANHIDAAFKTREYPWTRNVSFEDFCEYVLPYRIANEPVQEWLPIYTEYVKPVADSIYKESDSMLDFVSSIVKHFSPPTRWINSDCKFLIDLYPDMYIDIKYGFCYELSAWVVYTFKALGLPVTRDFTPNWANRSMGHNWAGIMIDGQYYPFLFLDKCKFGEHISSRQHEKPSKIFRHMYSLQPNSLTLQKLDKDVPALFKKPFLKDISGMYIDQYSDSCINIDVPIDYPSSNKIVYLMVFDNSQWVPVGWGAKNKDMLSFDKVRKGCCFIASYYENKKFIPATVPFYITSNNKIAKLFPKKNQSREVVLKRKYPFFLYPNGDIYISRVIGGKFQVADKADFSDAIDIFTIKEIGTMGYQVVQPDTSLKKRYFRYVSAPECFVYLAELNVYDNENNRLKGEIIGSEGSYNNNGYDKTKVFDGNPFTYFDAPLPSNCWGGLDFKEKKTIGKFAFLPLNDDNHIVENELYELFYFDKEWISLGKKTGNHTFILEYDNVPENALLHLKNHTKGKQERIFTYENGEQIWW